MTKKGCLEIVIDTGDDRMVSAEDMARVVKNVVKILKAIEKNKFGTESEWAVTAVKNGVDLRKKPKRKRRAGRCSG